MRNSKSVRLARLAGRTAAAALAWVGVASAQNLPVANSAPAWAQKLPGHWTAPPSVVWGAPGDPHSWRVGVFGGVYNNGYLRQLQLTPWSAAGEFRRSYLLGADATYTVAQLPYLPVDFELYFVAAHHFGDQSYEEFAFTPTFRWKWFPWNDYVYTNLRIGPFGVSYATQIPNLELEYSVNHRDSKVLNAFVYELTFAPSRDSAWEAVFKIHHRSGIYGRINGADSGANWVALGLREHF